MLLRINDLKKFRLGMFVYFDKKSRAFASNEPASFQFKVHFHNFEPEIKSVF
jgi:hypothetical protein